MRKDGDGQYQDALIFKQTYSQCRKAYDEGDYDTAMQRIVALLSKESEITDKIFLGKLYSLKGATHCKLGELKEASESHFYGSTLFEKMGNKELFATAMTNLLVVDIEEVKLVNDPNLAEISFIEILSSIEDKIFTTKYRSIKATLHCLAMVCCKFLARAQSADKHLETAKKLAQGHPEVQSRFDAKSEQTEDIIELRMNDRNGRWADFMAEKNYESMKLV